MNLINKIFLTLAYLVLFGCAKESVQIDKDNNIENNYAEYAYTNQYLVVNNQNVYDYMGSIHNEALDVAISLIDYNDPENSFYDALEDYYSNEFQEFNGWGTTEWDEMYAHIDTLRDSLSDTTDLHYNYLIDYSNMSVMANNYARDIINELLNNKAMVSSNVQGFQNNLITIENNISIDGQLTPDEKQTLLSLAAVMRYSSAYWAFEYSKGETSNWSDSEHFGMPNWVIAMMDAAFMLGALAFDEPMLPGFIATGASGGAMIIVVN